MSILFLQEKFVSNFHQTSNLNIYVAKIVKIVQYLPSVFYTCFSDSAVNFMSTITLEHAYITVCQWNTCDVFVYIWLTNQSRATLVCQEDTWHIIVTMHHVELWCWTEYQMEYDIPLQVILAWFHWYFLYIWY